MRLLIPLCLAIALGGAALAQSPKPGEEGATLCALIDGPFRFCGTPPAFTLTPQTDNAEVTSYYTTPEGIQVALIVENLGSNDGLSVQSLQQAALTILSNASGTPVAAIPVLERSTQIVDGVPRQTFVYRGDVGGVTYVYSNTVVLLPDHVAQFVTIQSRTMVMSPTHRDVHMRVLANAQVNR